DVLRKEGLDRARAGRRFHAGRHELGILRVERRDGRRVSRVVRLLPRLSHFLDLATRVSTLRDRRGWQRENEGRKRECDVTGHKGSSAGGEGRPHLRCAGWQASARI